MADDYTKSRDDAVNDSDVESEDGREEVLLLESDSDDDSDSGRKPVDLVLAEKEERKIPGIDPRIDQSLSDIVKEQKHVKRYENKNSAKFVTGLDITSKEARKKRAERAKRFGLASKDKSGEKEEDEEEEDEDISNVILAPGSKIGGSLVRLEAIHLIGVDEMSTQDIFSYFQSYDPSSIEWINDTSCNIVWLDPHSAARALLGMSKPREGYFKLGLKNLAQSRHNLIEPEPVESPQPRVDQDPEPMEEGGDEDEDGVDLVSDRETGEKVRPPPARIIPTSPTNSHSNYASRREEGMEGIQLGDEDLGPVDIAHEEALRRGRSHHSTDELLMRYATKDDVKERGAYKHSQYYIKYGNPNFGGMRGIITQSMKQKIRQGKYIPGQARKRRYEDDSDGERELEEEWPRKRRVPGRLERRLGERETGRHHPSPLQPAHSEDEAGPSSGEEEEEEGVKLEAAVRHAMRDRDDGRHKMTRRMYADEIEDEIKKIRDTVEVQQATQNVMTDARERLRQSQGQSQERLSVKSRLGALVGHSVTPAPSMENLKVILDVNDRVSDVWPSSGEEEGAGSIHDEVDCNSDELDLGSDLRSRLSRRQQDPARFRPGFRESDSRPTFLENLPSLQIEIREEL